MLQRILKASITLAALLLGDCVSDPPPLATTPEQGATLPFIINHINCELASILDSAPNGPVSPTNAKIYEQAQIEPRIFGLLRKLVDYHFVASVFLTIDASDTEGLSPSLTFIHPLSSTFSRVVNVNPQLSGTQERNKTIGYSVDMALVRNACRSAALAPASGISGDLGLADIIIEGLNGLEASQNVNVYSSGGPTRPAFDALADIRLGATCTSNTGMCKSNSSNFNISINHATMNFAPGNDPEQPGNLSLTGEAKTDDGRDYMLSLNGSTVAEYDKTIRFTLTGNMTREGNFSEDTLGFNPTMTLTGKIDKNYAPREPSGLLTPSADALSKALPNFSFLGKDLPSPHTPAVVGDHDKPTMLPGPKEAPKTSTTTAPAAPPDHALGQDQGKTGDQGKSGGSGSGGGAGGGDIPSKDVFVLGTPIGKPAKATLSDVRPVALTIGSASSGVGQGSGAPKGAALSGGNPSQFGSLVNFSLSFGLNGGPTWTLSTFKGPAGGGGAAAGGQLFGANRTYTDTLTITFVPACQDHDVRKFQTFWDTVPKCNGTGNQAAAAAAIGYQYNVLLQTGRGL